MIHNGHLAGDDFYAHGVFNALAAYPPNDIQALQGTSRCGDSAEYCSKVLLGWQKFWLCMPSLKTLTWSFPSCALPCPVWNARFGLPTSLQCLDITIWWDHGDGDADLDLSFLFEGRWDEKLTSLKIICTREREAHEAATPPADVDFEDLELPVLESLHCQFCSLSGTLHAVNLKHLDLDCHGEDEVNFSVFEHCCLLESIKISSGTDLNCFGCSFPDSLTELSLNVVMLLEDGCFSKAPPNLRSVFLSIIVDFDHDGIDLSPFTSRGATSVKVDPPTMALWLPPEDDPHWS